MNMPSGILAFTTDFWTQTLLCSGLSYCLGYSYSTLECQLSPGYSTLLMWFPAEVLGDSR